MNNFFITALLQASSCHIHAKPPPNSRALFFLSGTHHKVRRKRAKNASAPQLLHSDHPDHGATRAKPIEISKDELHGIVDTYGEWGNRDVSVSEDAFVGPEVLDADIEQEYSTENEAHVQVDQDILTEKTVHDLRCLLEDKESPPDKVFDTYQALPAPRVLQISLRSLNRLLNHLSTVPRITEPVMLRYLSIIDDMKAANIPILLTQWNTAMHLAGKCGGPITMGHLETALSIWKEMENEVGIKGDPHTFSILFDFAIKAEQFSLADMIETEGRKRGHQLDRISRMARIYYQGIRGDGSGVRRAYSELVEAGEIVDTSVLTNVITSLIKAGEFSAAEMTFDRMKRLHAEKTGATAPPDNWRDERELRKILTQAAHRWRTNAEARHAFQEASPIAPDWRTYRAFIRYHANDSGNYDRIMELVGEMKQSGIRLNGAIYHEILTGFYRHGGIQYSSWRNVQLEQIWEAFIKACEESPADTFLGHGITIAAMKAFARCAYKERTMEIWAEIRSKWEPEEKTLHAVNHILQHEDFIYGAARKRRFRI
jgi:pentatricopeptide repeat protein